MRPNARGARIALPPCRQSDLLGGMVKIPHAIVPPFLREDDRDVVAVRAVLIAIYRNPHGLGISANLALAPVCAWGKSNHALGD